MKQEKLSVSQSLMRARELEIEAVCLGACGYAPMLQCGNEYYEKLDEAKVDSLLNNLK